jgi:hypothetical protein
MERCLNARSLQGKKSILNIEQLQSEYNALLSHYDNGLHKETHQDVLARLLTEPCLSVGSIFQT